MVIIEQKKGAARVGLTLCGGEPMRIEGGMIRRAERMSDRACESCGLVDRRTMLTGHHGGMWFVRETPLEIRAKIEEGKEGG